ncbi:MAG: DUF3078 domain-containing protein [Bacteroidia bacterium]|nr:DUF3078 domain-containing protein [Bacteroidia bacterium]
MKKSLALLLFSIFTLQTFAQEVAKTSQDTTWKYGGFGALTFNQVSLTNWAAGGESSLSLSGLLSFYSKYKKGKTTWDSNLDLAYGFLKNENSSLRKNDDRIEFNSNFGHQAKGKFFYSANLNFRTQFAPGYSYPNDSVVTSRFMSPGYLTAALGFNYKEGDVFSVFLSPASGKFTFVLDQNLANIGAFGVKPAELDASGKIITPGKQVRAEFGASLTMKFQMDIMKNVNLKTGLQLFNNYTDKVAANRGNIDINWDVLISMKVNKFLTASLMTNLIYDHDVNLPTIKKVNGVKTEVGTGPKTQFKEVFGVGLSYRIDGISKK